MCIFAVPTVFFLEDVRCFFSYLWFSPIVSTMGFLLPRSPKRGFFVSNRKNSKFA